MKDKESFEFEYRGKTVVFNDVGEMYARHFREGEFYEHEFLEYISALNIVGTYLDIGCNRGNHLIYFGKFTPAVKVVGFEPLPHYASRIRDTIASNSLEDKAEVIQFAVSEGSGPLELEFMGKSYDVQTRRIDELSFSDVALMKIDIEGMELSALKGAKKTIEKFRPRIFVEALNRSDFDSISTFLADLDYTFTGRVFNASPTYEFSYVG